MKIILNQELHKLKKGSVVDLDRVNYQDQVYWNKRIKDSKIDNCVSILDESDQKKELKPKKRRRNEQ